MQFCEKLTISIFQPLPQNYKSKNVPDAECSDPAKSGSTPDPQMQDQAACLDAESS